MEYKLSDIFELQMGKTPDRSNGDYWSDGIYPWISIADLGRCNKYIDKTAEMISESAVDQSGIRVIPPNTVIMSFKLSIGKVAITSMPMYSNEAIMAFIDQKILNIMPEYLYYLLKHKDWDEGTNKAVMGKTLNKATLSDIRIKIHSIEDQTEIVRRLDCVDKIIRLRQRQLSELDTLIKARFVEMFGDFSSSNKWNECALGSICEKVIRYPTFYGMDYLEKGVKVIRIGNIMQDGHMDTDESKYVYVYESVNSDYPETVIEEQDIIMAVRGDGSAAKRIGIITEKNLFGANISPNLIRIKAKGEIIRPWYLFFFLTGQVGQSRLDAYVNKTAKKNIAAKDIVKVMVPVPPLEMQSTFEEFISQVDKSKLVAQKALDEVQLLFDSLMQEYFG